MLIIYQQLSLAIVAAGWVGFFPFSFQLNERIWVPWEVVTVAMSFLELKCVLAALGRPSLARGSSEGCFPLPPPLERSPLLTPVIEQKGEGCAGGVRSQGRTTEHVCAKGFGI